MVDELNDVSISSIIQHASMIKSRLMEMLMEEMPVIVLLHPAAGGYDSQRSISFACLVGC